MRNPLRHAMGLSLVLWGCDRGPAHSARPDALAAPAAVQPPPTVATDRPQPPPAVPTVNPGATVPSTDATITAEASARIRATVPPGHPLAVFLSVGEGERATRAEARLRTLLGQPPAVTFSVATVAPGGPVADPGSPGGHVNTQVSTVSPPPQVVVRISAANTTLYIAARPPGADPLGPPDNGWSWVLSSP